MSVCVSLPSLPVAAKRRSRHRGRARRLIWVNFTGVGTNYSTGLNSFGYFTGAANSSPFAFQLFKLWVKSTPDPIHCLLLTTYFLLLTVSMPLYSVLPFSCPKKEKGSQSKPQLPLTCLSIQKLFSFLRTSLTKFPFDCWDLVPLFLTATSHCDFIELFKDVPYSTWNSYVTWQDPNHSTCQLCRPDTYALRPERVEPNGSL